MSSKESAPVYVPVSRQPSTGLNIAIVYFRFLRPEHVWSYLCIMKPETSSEAGFIYSGHKIPGPLSKSEYFHRIPCLPVVGVRLEPAGSIT
ncbi:hypothetical protein J6590_008967 [Homalodisca vitripennis]|nr:hypothetical protein J6590_008967 [Homalodisca vitripennis]